MPIFVEVGVTTLVYLGFPLILGMYSLFLILWTGCPSYL
uniref:Uncharacterized protein MANES_06G044700 n=1 Tax=Rhizophora mucronata TaxID=61149 RepID=A0A2P2M786_RHIMU